jgi:Spy/CpxP family protein refolding chaperone
MGMMGGMGMMGLGPIGRLDLNDTQHQQVLKIEDELRRKNWDVMGKMQDEMAKLRDSMWSGKRDRAAILAANKRMSDLRQQMLENSLDARDKAEAVLTPQQREQLRRFGP